MIEQARQNFLANLSLFKLKYINVGNTILQIPPAAFEAFPLHFFFLIQEKLY